jgi:hypothetical protein
MLQLNAHQLSALFQNWKSIHFPITSQGLLLNTIVNALTQALQSVKKWKDMQCCQLKFLQCSQHKLYSSILSVSIVLCTLCLLSTPFTALRHVCCHESWAEYWSTVSTSELLHCHYSACCVALCPHRFALLACVRFENVLLLSHI